MRLDFEGKEKVREIKLFHWFMINLFIFKINNNF